MKVPYGGKYIEKNVIYVVLVVVRRELLYFLLNLLQDTPQ